MCDVVTGAQLNLCNRLGCLCLCSGTVANVLSQIILPFNMVGSLLFLHTRYRKVHYIGSILAVYGVVRAPSHVTRKVAVHGPLLRVVWSGPQLVRLIPRFDGNAKYVHDPDGHAEGWAYFGWVVMMVVAQVPAAASNGTLRAVCRVG